MSIGPNFWSNVIVEFCLFFVTSGLIGGMCWAIWRGMRTCIGNDDTTETLTWIVGLAFAAVATWLAMDAIDAQMAENARYLLTRDVWYIYVVRSAYQAVLLVALATSVITWLVSAGFWRIRCHRSMA